MTAEKARAYFLRKVSPSAAIRVYFDQIIKSEHRGDRSTADIMQSTPFRFAKMSHANTR